MVTRPRVRSVTPLLVVADLQRSIDFYQGKLSFVDPMVHGEPPCFAMLNRDGFDLMLSLACGEARVQPNGPAGVWDLYIAVADLAAECAALEEAGVPLVKGPTETFYAMREVECLDPDGYRICLAQDIGEERFRVAEAWSGTLEVGGKALRLVLKAAPSGEGLVGRLDSLDQNAFDLPIDSLVRDGDSLRFTMTALGAKYEGTLSSDGNEVVGVWSQRGQSWPLTFRRT